ncbi:Cupredoxin [Mycotypha africana]|uniref:Cupredoxin n=1 Tax=Mycotypha africana TaxID=64632 RepID=UPI002301E7C9|nr:Cupredoxin [Mycotypha africana]KAI8991621.1 Cupredoxin [Mycotypha africana]
MQSFTLFITFFCFAFANAVDYFDQLQNELNQSPTGQVRRFYITAEETIWDYTAESSQMDEEYEDLTYTRKKERYHWQGNMGPILRAEVGDIIQVFFWNRASRNYTIHPHGIFYEFEMEGAVFKGAYEGSSVTPNHNYTYTWNVLPRAGPGPKDGNSIVWGYHSHVTENDIYAGLYGAIVIYKPGTLNTEDLVSSVFIMDENLSPYLAKTMAKLYPDFNDAKYDKKTIYNARTFPSINGLSMASPKDLVLKGGKELVWHLLGWGTYWDVQYLKWQNAEVILDEQKVDYVRLMPASFYTVTVISQDVGVYKFGYLENSDRKCMAMNYRIV